MGNMDLQTTNITAGIFGRMTHEIIFIMSILVAWLVLWLLKKFRLSKLKKEEITIYYNALEKIKKIDLANKIFVVIGIILFVIVAIIKINIFPGEYMGNFGLTRVYPMIEATSIAQYYIVIYYILHILFSKFYIGKRIEKHEALSENEKLLLNKYYIKSIGTYIYSVIILEIAVSFHMLFTTMN